MARSGRYTELLKGLKGEAKVTIKKGLKLDHERRYIYGQAARLGRRVEIRRVDDHTLTVEFKKGKAPTAKKAAPKKKAAKRKSKKE